MTSEEAIEELDKTDLDDDPELSHSYAEDIILTVLPLEVRAAYMRRVGRTWGWWFA